jgi:hypothetical protein
MVIVREFQHRHQQRRADGTAAGLPVVEIHGLAMLVEEHVGAGAGGRGFAALVATDGFALCIVVDQKAAAADAGGLRLHQAQHKFRGDGGVHRRAALAQHRQRRIDRARIGGSRHRFAARRGRWRLRRRLASGNKESQRGQRRERDF